VWIATVAAKCQEPAFFVAGVQVVKASETLAQAPDSVFRIWRNRLRIEYEAASLFGQLGDQLTKIYGEKDEVVGLCQRAEQEELNHARMCIEIIKYSGEPVEFSYKRQNIHLGPLGLSLSRQILYTSLALSCVTETLSTALLTEMAKRAEPGLIHNTVHQILKDEVRHARLGWAQLNRQKEDLNWVQPYIPLMIKEAVFGEIQPMLSRDLSSWGILSPRDAQIIIQNTIEQVIRPGLERYGLKVITDADRTL
jgi:hypothetical protein